ncbi:MAG: SusC/RagA family TonB-linked outer membrane protein [Bacteroidota bacterium]
MNNKSPKYHSKKIFFLILFVMLLMNSNAFAQSTQREISGTVTSSEDGTALPDVSILIKGTNQGVTTDFDGNYRIKVPDNNAILVFSYVGYKTKEITVGIQTTINVILNPSTETLDEVTVTALGILREEKSLGYDVETVEAAELTRVVNENVLNSISGKVSGVTINSTGGTGSSVSMVIRGAVSLSSDNQPLFVVDGVPIQNTVDNVGGFGSDNRVDYGNAISDLDPESIENVTILKGSSAAALYGSRAGNGVVLITTKKAKEGERMQVSVVSNTVFDIPDKFVNTTSKFSTGFFSFRPEDVGGILPEISAGDGTFAGPENDKGYWAVQWHSPKDANGVPIPIEVVSYPNNVENFLNNYAYTATNSISISNSTDIANFRLGYTNMTHEGLIPNSDLHKNSYNLSASSKLWDKVTISTDINFSNSWADNRPSSNRGTNPLQWAFAHPSNIDIRDLRNYETGGSDILRVSGNHENPYFLAYGVNNSFDRYRIFGNVIANWEVTPDFNIRARYTLNKTDGVRETKISPGYSKEPNNGAYGIEMSTGLERNMDILGTYGKDWDNFNLSASLGGNIRYEKFRYNQNSSPPNTGLIVPNLFTIDNIKIFDPLYNRSRSSERAVNSIYAMATFGWKDYMYLDVTGRNDWSSTLPSENWSYFYPSASLSVLLNKLFGMNNNNVNMLKLRAGWAESGNDTHPYMLKAVYGNGVQWDDAVSLTKTSELLNPNLRPEKATSFEFGTDIKLFNNRLRFEGTYYMQENEDQLFDIDLASSSGYNKRFINAGLMESKGWELMLGVTPIKTDNWNWDLNMNFTKNETKIIELAEGVEFLEFWDNARVRSRGYAENKELGHDGLVGNLYSRKVKRVTDENSPYFGYPILGSGIDTEWEAEEEYSKVGNYNPDFIMGLQSSLSFKNITLSMTFDWRSGGQYVSQTYRYLSESVNTQSWLDELVNPGELGGGSSQELRDWVVANADELLLSDRLRPVGGPTPEYGGFPEQFSGVTVYDGTFAPGVIGYHDENGNFILVQENLGGEGTTFLPYVVSYPWDIGTTNMFDADYVKLREISLTYNLPDKTLKGTGVSNVNFSIYSRNIMLWTKDSGFGIDPERAFQAEGNGTFSQGVERYNVNPWVIPIGFKIGFTF